MSNISLSEVYYYNQKSARDCQKKKRKFCHSVKIMYVLD